METYQANGKLLLSGEYLVLDGALALALPTRFGQRLQVLETGGGELHWESLDSNGEPWFEGRFSLAGKYLSGSDDPVGRRLETLWAFILSKQPDFLSRQGGGRVRSQLDFPRDWGLGSSSTLIYLLSQWTGVDAFPLSQHTFGGSGYDIACAAATQPIFYQLQQGKPVCRAVHFAPGFSESLYFVHLGQKQDSREGIADYRKRPTASPATINHISIISKRMANATTLNEFQSLIRHHDSIMTNVLDRPTVKVERFQDFWGEVKSLGAWGGDFAIVASHKTAKATRAYFEQKGLDVFLPYAEMVLCPAVE